MLDNYIGSDIKFFGTFQTNTGEYYGGSTRTAAFKMAMSYLTDTLNVQYSPVKSIADKNTKKNNTSNSHEDSISVKVLTTNKNKTVALILCILFGYLGGHYFYVGRIGMGILYLFTLGLFGIGWIIDIIRILINRFPDKNGRIIC
jgi:hypothetical protein